MKFVFQKLIIPKLIYFELNNITENEQRMYIESGREMGVENLIEKIMLCDLDSTRLREQPTESGIMK